jgi:hypothetical protein
MKETWGRAEPCRGSVATVMIDIFQINSFSVRSKSGKIAKIFEKIEDTKD